MGLCSTKRRWASRMERGLFAERVMSSHIFMKFLFYVTVLKISNIAKHKTINYSGMMLMQEFSLPLMTTIALFDCDILREILRQYIQIAIFYFPTRMLKSFFRAPDLHFMVWGASLVLQCINYGSVISCLLRDNFFTLQSFLECY